MPTSRVRREISWTRKDWIRLEQMAVRHDTDVQDVISIGLTVMENIDVWNDEGKKLVLVDEVDDETSVLDPWQWL